MVCMPKQIKFDSPLLKNKKHRDNLQNKAFQGQRLGDYNYNRNAMKKLIKRLVDNRLVKNAYSRGR